MDTYRTAQSDDGLRLPHSGVLVGKLVGYLRLKPVFREDFAGASYKTVQRYFAGDRVQPEVVSAILKTIVGSCIPVALPLPTAQMGIGSEKVGTVVEFLEGAIGHHVRRWDNLAAEVNGNVFPVQREGDLPVPILRLAALDLGIRYGAWLALLFLNGEPPPAFPAEWLTPQGLRTVVDELRTERDLTLEELADRVGVSVQTLSGWRGGTNLPTGANIEALARALTGAGTERWRVEGRIRLVVAAVDLRRSLDALCGEARVGDMVEAHILTAKHVLNLSVGPMTSGEPRTLDLRVHLLWEEEKARAREVMPSRVWQLLMFGAACPTGEVCCEELAKRAAFRQEVSTDFLALPTDWVGRVQYWMDFLANRDHQIEFARQHLSREFGADPAHVGPAAELAAEVMLRMGQFDTTPPPGMTMLRVTPPPFGKAMNRVLQADRAESVGNRVLAIEHMRAAVKHQPMGPSLHFKLGCLLWQHGFRDPRSPDVDLMEQGLLECRVAVQLDPEFGNARNEIAIILSNLSRWDEAEQAYSEAERYHGGHAHHWFGRGINHLFLGQVKCARAALETCIRLTKEEAHVEAKYLLAVCLMALDEKREGQRLGKHVEHVTGTNPAKHWREIIQGRFHQDVPD